MQNVRMSFRPRRGYGRYVLCAAAAIFILATAVGPSAQGKPAPPTFKVDPTWPQEMPNHWIMGAVTGVFVDSKQHVWVAHLPETLTEEELYEEPWKVGAGADPAKPKPVQIATCCKAAPPILEFDQQGKLVQGWGQGTFTDFTDWPREPHGIFVEIPVWYVLAVDIDKDAARMFRMDRIAYPRPIARRFTPSREVVAETLGDVPHAPLVSGA